MGTSACPFCTAIGLLSFAPQPRERPAMLRQSNDGALRILTLDRPEQRNALNLPLLKALRAALAAAAGEQEVRALILTGAGKGFCAGADIAEWAEAEAAGRLETYGWTDESHAL